MYLRVGPHPSLLPPGQDSLGLPPGDAADQEHVPDRGKDEGVFLSVDPAKAQVPNPLTLSLSVPTPSPFVRLRYGSARAHAKCPSPARPNHCHGGPHALDRTLGAVHLSCKEEIQILTPPPPGKNT